MCSNEAECSNSESANQEKFSREELLAEILKSPTEYTTEKITALSKIRNTLKTNRPLKINDYFYGLSLTLQREKRLIVFEWDNRGMVREYTQRSDRKTTWECRSCELQYRHQKMLTRCFLYIIDGIIFVPLKHECPPRDYELVMQYQKFLEEGDTVKARRMAIMIDFTFQSNSLSNVINVISTESNSNHAKTEKVNDMDGKISTSLKRKSNDNVAEKIYINKKNKNVTEKVDPPINRKSKDFEKKVKAINPFPVITYSFEMPSNFELKQICNKLGIKYSKDANEFWKEIMFRKIDFSSKNVKTQKFKTKNFYKLLSNFLTGKFCNYEQIYYSINCALRDKLVADGDMPFEEIDFICSTYTVTEKHFAFITKFIPCKILIFDRDEDEVKKYGKWKNTNNSNVLTLVVSFLKGKYSAVVNL